MPPRRAASYNGPFMIPKPYRPNFIAAHVPGKRLRVIPRTGMDEDLDVAVQNCVRAAIALLQARYGMDASLAYAYLSAATDFNISQVVDLVKGVHARVRTADFDD